MIETKGLTTNEWKEYFKLEERANVGQLKLMLKSIQIQIDKRISVEIEEQNDERMHKELEKKRKIYI